MNNTQSSSRFVAAALIASLPVVAAATIQAQSAKGDGIKVHGHWTIDVRNADGALASHNEFENALEPSGGVALTGLLARNLTPTAWRLDLTGANTSTGPCEKLPASSGGATSSLMIAAPGAVTINPDGSVTWTGTLPLGAPAFDFGGVYRTALPQSPVQHTFQVTDPDNDPIISVLLTTSTGQPIPGLSLVFDGVSTSTLNWTGQGIPGTYSGSIIVADNTGASTTYNVSVTEIDPTAPPESGVATPWPCSAVEAFTNISSDLANAWFPTLAFNLVPIGNGSQNLEVSGNVTVSTSESIEQVRSVLVMSNSATLPFSSRVLPTPIQVVPGQKVYVKVAFSFS